MLLIPLGPELLDFLPIRQVGLKSLLRQGLSEPDALAVCRAHRGLPVGFLLLRYSVLFTVESLSLHYLLVIS